MMMMMIIHFSFLMWVRGALMTHVADLSIIIRACNRIDSCLISQLLLSRSSKIIIYYKGVHYYITQKEDYKIVVLKLQRKFLM